MAEDLQDVSLMARIEGGYLIVLEAKISLVKLRNQHRLHDECSSKSHEESEANVESWGIPSFELRSLYEHNYVLQTSGSAKKGENSVAFS